MSTKPGEVQGSIPTDEIGCAVLKSFTLKSDDDAHEFTMRLTQAELEDVDPENEMLSLTVTTPPSRTPSIVLTFIDLVPLDDTGRFTEAEAAFEERGEIGGVTYENLYSTVFSAGALAQFGPDEVRLEELALSRGTGLVALRRSDVGELYLDSSSPP